MSGQQRTNQVASRAAQGKFQGACSRHRPGRTHLGAVCLHTDDRGPCDLRPPAGGGRGAVTLWGGGSKVDGGQGSGFRVSGAWSLGTRDVGSG